MFFFFKQKTAYEMRISDWSSDVCSSDLPPYNQGLAEKAVAALLKAGWIASGTLLATELMKSDPFEVPSGFSELDARNYDKARLLFLRYDGYQRRRLSAGPTAFRSLLASTRLRSGGRGCHASCARFTPSRPPPTSL